MLKCLVSCLVYFFPRRETHSLPPSTLGARQFPASSPAPIRSPTATSAPFAVGLNRLVWQRHPSFRTLFPWEMALRFQAARSTQKPTFGTAATGQRRRLNAGCHGNHRSQNPSQCTGNPNSTSHWKLLPKRQHHRLGDFSDAYNFRHLSAEK